MTRLSYAPRGLGIKENRQKVAVFFRHIRHLCAYPYNIFHIVPSFALQDSPFLPILVWGSLFSAAEFDTRAASLNQEEIYENNSLLQKCNFQLVALSPHASKSSPSYFLKQDNDSAVRGSQFHFYEVKPDWILILFSSITELVLAVGSNLSSVQTLIRSITTKKATCSFSRKFQCK